MPDLQYNGELHIAVFTSRKAKTGKNKAMQWSELLDALLTTTRTKESLRDYFKLGKEEQDRKSVV